LFVPFQGIGLTGEDQPGQFEAESEAECALLVGDAAGSVPAAVDTGTGTISLEVVGMHDLGRFSHSTRNLAQVPGLVKFFF
jgi:hypothetical protein